MDETQAQRRLLARALGEGDAAALDQVVELISPVVHVRVARALRRRSEARKRKSLRTDLEDMTQDVFVALFAKSGKALRSWNPERGLDLLAFVGFLAEREVAMRMRTAKRNPWIEEPTEHQDFEWLAPSPGPSCSVEARDLLRKVLDGLLAWFTPEGRNYFELLYVQEIPVSEVARRANTTSGALYAWRGRMLRQARQIRDQALSESEGCG